LIDAIEKVLKGGSYVTPRSPRKEFFYWTDDGDFAGLRYEKWKHVFLDQRAHGFDVWGNPLIPLRVALIEDLRADPYERAS
jgi:arylsulfatase A-like enzyme